MVNDTELLRLYATDRCEVAFAELVGRHIKLVYGAALRETAGDTSLAEDVCQDVFLELAKHPSRMQRHPALAGWLYTTVRHMAANVRRNEARRRRREQEAQIMNDTVHEESSDPNWLEVKPVLDDALHELSETDRAAVVLRFFGECTIEQVGLALGLNKSAAHMRIDRALEKLRSLLCKRGVTCSCPALAAALAIGASVAVPEGVAAAVTAQAMAATLPVASTSLALKIMTMTKMKIAIASTLITAAVATPLVLQHQAQVRLRLENQALQEELGVNTRLADENQQLSNRLAQLSASVQPNSREGREQSELLRLRGEVAKLRRENQEQRTLLSSKARNSTKLPNTLLSRQSEDNTAQASFQVQQAQDQVKQALAAQAGQRNDGQLPNGAVAVTSDPSGDRRLMQFTDGQWNEVDASAGWSLTPEGALVMKTNSPSNPAGNDQTQYLLRTNAPASSNP
jgi:RNA polymerase sigma factor (sigma-70 family)